MSPSDHSLCEAAYNDALAKGHDGRAEFILTHCETQHGGLTAPVAPPPEEKT